MPQDWSRRAQSAASKMDDEYFCTKVILIIYKILGLAPWVITRRSPGGVELKNDTPRTLTTTQFAYSGLGTAYHMILVVLVFGIIFWSLPELYNIDYPYETQLIATIELAQAVCSNIIIMVLRILLCVKQKTAVKLFNRFAIINGTIVCLAKNRKSESNRLFFVLLFLINGFVAIVVFLSERKCYNVSLISMMNCTYPFFVMNWFIMQYVIMVKLIENRFRTLNRALLDNSRSLIVQPVQSFIRGENSINAFHNPKIMTFRRTHTVLYEIICDVSEFYSLSILLTVAVISFSIIYQVYFLIMPFVLQLKFNEACIIVNGLSCLAGLMLPIVMLAVGVNRITSEIRKTADAVHRLLARSTTSPEDKSELQQFSLELLQRNVNFTAYGLFPLDCTLVHSIFSAVVTYLIILFQFQLASEKSSLQIINENNSTSK